MSHKNKRMKKKTVFPENVPCWRQTVARSYLRDRKVFCTTLKKKNQSYSGDERSRVRMAAGSLTPPRIVDICQKTKNVHKHIGTHRQISVQIQISVNIGT